MILETKRCILRPWQKEDDEILFAIAKDPKVGPICGWDPHPNQWHSKHILERILCVNNTFAIVYKETNAIIGNISLMPFQASNFAKDESEAEVGYWLSSAYWNLGIMSECLAKIIEFAFINEEMQRLWCGYFEENIASKKVQKKCGFIHHHIVYDLPVPSLHKNTNLYASVLDKKEWEKKHGN